MIRYGGLLDKRIDPRRVLQIHKVELRYGRHAQTLLVVATAVVV